MVEKKFFYEYPDIYPEYLTALLLKESTALWMEQSEAYELSQIASPIYKRFLSKGNPVSEIYDRRGSEKISGTERMAEGTEKTDGTLEN